MATMEELINRTITRLSMTPGVGTQTYAEDQLMEMIQHKFDVLFDDYWWPQFRSWYEWTLDGTLGVVTTDLTDIVKRFQDIKIVYPNGSDRPLGRLPDTISPFNISGTTPRFVEPINTVSKRFRVWPRASTGSLDVLARTKPDTYVPEDEVDFDDQLLILGAAYDYLEDDGTNPAATGKMLSLFTDRRNQLVKSLDSMPTQLDPYSAQAPDGWQQLP